MVDIIREKSKLDEEIFSLINKLIIYKNLVVRCTTPFIWISRCGTNAYNGVFFLVCFERQKFIQLGKEDGERNIFSYFDFYFCRQSPICREMQRW